MKLEFDDGNELVQKVKELIHEGNVRRIVIKNDQGHTVMEIPVTLGIVGAIAAPVLAAVGAVGALAGKWTIEFDKRDEPEGSATPATPEG
ncbi:MAG: DUF4342 domain-containing protein [Actinomycetota bacterium]